MTTPIVVRTMTFDRNEGDEPIEELQVHRTGHEDEFRLNTETWTFKSIAEMVDLLRQAGVPAETPAETAEAAP